jgi:membrane associated rhomboid family serine protease
VAIFVDQEVIRMFTVRVILWTVAMAYTGFILTNQGLRTFNGLSITEAFLGALTGFLLAVMFTLRERRRQRPALVVHSIAQFFPDWVTSRENRDSDSKLNR